jgi:molybdopterin synthase catalytic subunit
MSLRSPLASSCVNACVKAVAWLIDELKAKVPIWKKEVFEGGEIWKENAESRLLAQQAQ